jgi:hypothetical protein
MHPYASDAARGRTVLLGLAVAAILLAWGFGKGLAALHLVPPWWLDTPAVLGFYGLLWKAYDQSLWRLRWRGRTLSGVPDYGGVWDGHLHSSYGEGLTVPATLTIRQTSSRILIELTTGTSRSASEMAAVNAAPGRDYGLRYVYANLPSHRPATSPRQRPHLARMMPHEGMSRLKLCDGGRRLEGDYQNDRFRGTHGGLQFKRREGGGGDSV